MEQAETVNNIILNDAQMLFYNLNVIHDIIHDYGFYAAETRWTKNYKNASQFLPGRYTMTFDYTDDKEADDKEAEEEEDMRGGMDTPQTGKRTTDDRNLDKDSNDAPPNTKRKTNTDTADETNNGVQPTQPSTPPSTPPQTSFNNGETRSPLKTPENTTSSPISTARNLTREIDRKDNVKNNNQIINFSLQTDLNKTDLNKTKQIIYSEYLEFIEQIKNATMFNFFGFITSDLNSNGNLLTTNANTIINCYQLAYDIIVPVDPEEYETEESIVIVRRGGGNIQSNPTPPLFELYCAIADDFGDYLYARYGEDITIEPIKNKQQRIALNIQLTQATAQATTNSTKTDIFRLFDDLSNFLDTDIILNNNSVDVINNIIRILKGIPFNGGGLKGGAVDLNEYAILKARKDNISNIVYNSGRYGALQAIIENPQDNGNYNQDQKNNYDTILNDIVTQIAATFIDEDERRNVINAFNTVKRLVQGRQKRNATSIFQTEIDKAVNTILNPIIKKIKEYEKVNARQIQEAAKAQAKAQAKEEKRAKAEATGDLEELKSVREQFLNATAVLGLYLNEELQQNNNSGNNDDFFNNLLKTEKEILGYYKKPSRPSKRELDTILFNEVKQVDNDIFSTANWGGGKLYCNTNLTQPLYIIDNAAIMPDGVRAKNVFCPLSSIIDGMNQCTLGAEGTYAANSIEYGNMNFKIMNNNNAYYNGKLELCNDFRINTLNNIVTYTVKYKGFNYEELETSIENIQIKNGKIRDLEAHNVLKNTLVNILRFFIELLEPTNTEENRRLGSYLSSTNNNRNQNIFENIITAIIGEIRFSPLDTETYNVTDYNKNALLNAFFTILGKGAGDIFQEINTVCKNGGYTHPSINVSGSSSSSSSSSQTYSPLFSDDNIARWSDGNAKRCFAANDRPSATRFIFLVKYGNANQINQYSFGGYVSNEDYLVKRTDGPVCMYPTIRGGSIKRKHNSKKHKKMKKTKKQINRKPKKYSKKYKYTKKRNKTKRNI
jgi:hypothetical protein